MKKIIILSTDYRYFRLFYLSNLKLLEGVDITVIAHNEFSETIDRRINFIEAKIHRKIAIIGDLRSFVLISIKCLKIRPDLVISIMPKTGFFNAVMARFFRYKSLHIFTGQVWANEARFLDKVLKKIDHFIAQSIRYLYADGASQIHFLETKGIVNSTGIKLIGNGSIAGVDRSRFFPQKREPLDSVRFLFLGRLCRDKGLDDLIGALELLQNGPKCEVLIFGEDEEGYHERLVKFENVTVASFTSCPELEMSRADVLLLPSHREGFGSVIAEAQFCGLWSIVSDTYGLRGIVTEGVNGYIANKGSPDSLYFAMKNTISNIAIIRNKKNDISKDAFKLYDQKLVQSFWKNELEGILND